MRITIADRDAAHRPLCSAVLLGEGLKKLFPLRSIVALGAACLCLVTLDVYAQMPAPASDNAFIAAYKLGPGDQITINVFGEENLAMDVEINDAGTLNYPFLGELKVEGVSVVELERLITNGLKGPYLVDPDVTVSVKKYRPFYLTGEVNQPGGIPYQPGLTLERAISLGGGFTYRANRKKIMVLRASDPGKGPRPAALTDPVNPGDVISVSERFF